MLVSILITAFLSTTGNFHGFVLFFYLSPTAERGEKIKFLSAVIAWLDAMPTAYVPVIEGEQMEYS